MKTGRGCFSLALNDGFVYVFGGVTGAQEPATTNETVKLYGPLSFVPCPWPGLSLGAICRVGLLVVHGTVI